MLPQMNRPERFKRPSKTRARGGERWRQVSVLAAVAGIVAIGLFVASEFEFASFLTARLAAKPAVAKSDDEIYTGSVLYLPNEGNICRQFLFDNRNGRMRDNGLVDCDEASYRGTDEGGKQLPNARAMVISESFRRH
jgi:hypothetical protein